MTSRERGDRILLGCKQANPNAAGGVGAAKRNPRYGAVGDGRGGLV